MSFFRILDKLVNLFFVDNLDPDVQENKIESVSEMRDWALDRVNVLYDDNQYENAQAISQEFNEWIDPHDEEIEYLYLDDQGWTEQEIDVR